MGSYDPSYGAPALKADHAGLYKKIVSDHLLSRESLDHEAFLAELRKLTYGPQLIVLHYAFVAVETNLPGQIVVAKAMHTIAAAWNLRHDELLRLNKSARDQGYHWSLLTEIILLASQALAKSYALPED